MKVKSYASPFYYSDQLQLYLYNSYEDVNSYQFIIKISSLILDLKQKIKKRMLVLCTSFKQIDLFKNEFCKYNENDHGV